MKEHGENSETAIRYLFGELDEDERARVEERLFADEEYSLFLDSVENDLVDEYARGEMDFAARRKFENKYLTSERRREKLRAARVLQNEIFGGKANGAQTYAARLVSVRQILAGVFRVPNLLRASGAAAILLLILFGVWLFLRQTENRLEIVRDENANRQIVAPTPEISPNVVQPNDDRAANAAHKSAEEKPLPSPTKNAAEKPADRETAAPREPRVFAFTLIPATRSGERPALNVPREAETVRLRVVHENRQSFIKYRAEIRDQNGDLIWSREIPVGEKTLVRPITLNVRRAALADGAYELTLSGITADNRLEEIKFYNFTVRKK